MKEPKVKKVEQPQPTHTFIIKDKVIKAENLESALKLFNN